jgi:hypothetical protein
MTPETTIYELFEQYLAGELPANETAALEKELQINARLKEEFDLYCNLQNDFLQMETGRAQESALAETLQQYNQQYFTAQQPQQAKVVSMKRRWYMVAAAASLIAAFFLLKPMLFTASDKNLFNEYYSEEGLSGVRGDADSVSRSAELFNAKKYAEALTILEPYTAVHPDATSLIMAKGTCYMQTAAFEKANAVFTPIASGQTAYAARAQWMLAMVALKQDDKAACKPLLEKIPAGSDYYTRARRLLKQL